MLVECTHQAMVVIICPVEVMYAPNVLQLNDIVDCQVFSSLV